MMVGVSFVWYNPPPLTFYRGNMQDQYEGVVIIEII
jgi:hypothetical protein